MSQGGTPTTVGLSFFDRPVAVEAGDLAEVVQQLWHPFRASSTDSTAPREPTEPTEPTAVVVPAGLGTPAARLGWLNSALNSAAMELTPQLAVHAGVVRHGDAVVAFPAKSGVGKSTLTGACLRQGFDYVSDEALCLDYDDGLVHPYPRPLGLSRWSARLLDVTGRQADDDVLVLARDLGAATAGAEERLRVSQLVLLDRVEGAASTLAPAARHEAIEALLRMSFNHYLRPADAVRLVASVIAATHVHTLTYGSATDAAALMARTFAPAISPLVGEIPHS